MSISPSTSPFRPWRDLIGPISSFSRPYSFSETLPRIKRNLHHFRANYAFLSLLILFLSLLWHPLSLIIFLIIFTAWIFLYFSRSSPIVVFHRTVSERFVMMCLFVVTIVGMVLMGVWVNVVVSGVVAVVVVGVHAVFRVPDDLFLDEDEAASGGLLSVVGSPPPARTRSNFASV